MTEQDDLEVIIDHSSLTNVVSAIASYYLKQPITLRDDLKGKLTDILEGKELPAVVEMLLEICEAKAQHIEDNWISDTNRLWGEDPQAQTWKSDRKKLLNIRKAKTLANVVLQN